MKTYKPINLRNKKPKQPSVALPILCSILATIGLCGILQSCEQPKPVKHKTEKVLLYKEVKKEPATFIYYKNNSKAIKRANNNLTKEQRNKAIAELFASKE